MRLVSNFLISCLVGHAKRGAAALEAQPTMTRELLTRRIAEAWLEGRRKA